MKHEMKKNKPKMEGGNETQILKVGELRLYGHMLGKQWEGTTEKMLNMQVRGKKNAQERCIDNIRKDMKINEENRRQSVMN